MKSFICLIFLLVNFLQLIGQKPPDKFKIKKESKKLQKDTLTKLSADTIDYFYMNMRNGYRLESVKGKSGKITHNCEKKLAFRVKLSEGQVGYFNKYYPNKFILGDTAISIEWYMKTDNTCFSNKCDIGTPLRFGRLKINERTNILSFEKFSCTEDKEIGKYKFKVIKFSEHEIILQDLQRRSEVFYHFIKN